MNRPPPPLTMLLARHTRRRDLTIGLLLAAAAPAVRAQEGAAQHRIAIVIASGPVARLNDPTSHAWRAFWEGGRVGNGLFINKNGNSGRAAPLPSVFRETRANDRAAGAADVAREDDADGPATARPRFIQPRKVSRDTEQP